MRPEPIIFLQSDCIGCGNCLTACAGEAFTSGGNYTAEFNPGLCLSCIDCKAGAECLGECIK